MWRSWCWWCGIWSSIKDGWGRSVRQGGRSVSHSSSRLCVCIHLFCFGALCPVWSRVRSQAAVEPKFRTQFLLAYMFSVNWRCRYFTCLSYNWDVCQLLLFFLYSLCRHPANHQTLLKSRFSWQRLPNHKSASHLWCVYPNCHPHRIRLSLKVDPFGKQCK